MNRTDKQLQLDELRTKLEIVSTFHHHNLHLPTRTIFLGSVNFDLDGTEGGVDAKMAEGFVKNMEILAVLGAQPITVVQNNVGGDEYHGLAIVDAIETSPCEVHVVVRGHAMSMGSWILQAATKRIMGPSSTQMIHYGTWGVHAHTLTSFKWADEGKRLNSLMEEMYLKRIRERHPKYTLARLRRLLDHDTFLTAQQSIDLGLADAIG